MVSAAVHAIGLVILVTAVQLTTGSVRLGSIADSGRLGSAVLNATHGRATPGAPDPACTLVPWILDVAGMGTVYAGPSTSTRLVTPDFGSLEVSMRPVFQAVSTLHRDASTGFLPPGAGSSGLALVALWAATDDTPFRQGESLGCANTAAVPVTLCVGTGSEYDPDVPCPEGTMELGLVPMCGSLFRGFASPTGTDPWIPGAGVVVINTLRAKVLQDSRNDGIVVVDGASVVVGNSRGIPGALRRSWEIYGGARSVGLWMLLIGAFGIVLLRAGWLWNVTSNHLNHAVSEPATVRIPSIQRWLFGVASSPLPARESEPGTGVPEAAAARTVSARQEEAGPTVRERVS
jgi:hypothetical protein